MHPLSGPPSMVAAMTVDTDTANMAPRGILHGES